DSNFVSAGGKTIYVLAPTTASVSKIERELAKQNDEFDPGGETLSVVRDFEARMLKLGLRSDVIIEAVGSAKDGAPSPWLQRKFDGLAQRASVPSNEPSAALKTVIANFQQQKEKTMPLSLEQFDERVWRANKSMDRLETMVDSSAERQAVEEMRRRHRRGRGQTAGRPRRRDTLPGPARAADRRSCYSRPAAGNCRRSCRSCGAGTGCHCHRCPGRAAPADPPAG
ncbi:hypothetical protein, partial [Ensifer sp. Root127]|uniref:hypothetical protein n=1 Tax=Ensifer sp. Root127 TaxID=1736440 RepID=UPI000A6F3F96